MGSGLYDWINWHLFTITANHNSSHIEILLSDICLTNLSEEPVTTPKKVPLLLFGTASVV
jgi:hypothetical protein